MTNLNVNIFKTGGKPHTLKKFELTEGSHVPIPQDSIVLFSEYVQEKGQEFIEVWAAVPDDAILLSERRNITGDLVPQDLPAPIPTDVIPDDIAVPEPIFGEVDDDEEYEEEFDPSEY